MLAITEPAGSGHLLQLPHDVLARIALLLAPVDVERVACSCKTLQRAMKDEAVWQALAVRDLPAALAPSTWLQQRHKGSHDEYHWPPQTYRCLLRSLQPFLQLGGLWKASSTELRPGTAASDNILAFKWTPAALVCLQLNGTGSSVDSVDIFWNIISVLSSKSALPRVEELTQGIIAILPAQAKESEASREDRERMQAALGASTHPLPGTSPPGSFESELLTFMRNTPPRAARATRRSKRRRSNPVAASWPHGMHLRCAATPEQHGLRSLSGLWAVCAHNHASDSTAKVVCELSVQVFSVGARLRGATVGKQQGLTLFVAETSFSSSRMGSLSEFWQKQGTAIDEAVQAAFSDSSMAAENLNSWYAAPGGIETTRWSEVVESLGLQYATGSGEGRDLSPESSMDANVDDIAGLTNNMSLHGDLSEVQWQVQRVLTALPSSGDSFPVQTVVDVVINASAAQRVVVLLSSDDKYQIMQRIELP